MKNVDNLKLWCLFRQRLSLQGEQNIVSAIDNALGKLGLVINSDNEIVSDEEQGEQKPAWSKEDDAVLNALIRRLEGEDVYVSPHLAVECLKSLKDRVQPKQEWNEEDEDNFKHLLDEIVCLGNNRNSANRLYYDRLIKFIEELKNRAQPKEKWCDKDERMLDRLIAYFEKRVAFTDDDNPRYANWLKSIKDRYTWKPSKGQLECLGYAIEKEEKDWCPLTNNRIYLTLKALKEQLLELRGSKV